MTQRPQKITFAELRAQGVHGLIIFCQDYRCSHNITMSADGWPDDVRLSDIEDRFVCTACGKRGADVRAGFSDAQMNRARRSDADIHARLFWDNINEGCIVVNSLLGGLDG